MTTALLVDAIAGDSHNIPKAANAAGYLTGAGIAWTTADWARFTGHKVRILQHYPAATNVYLQADALDVEKGALTIAQALIVAGVRRADKLDTTIYIEASQLAAARKAFAGMAGITFWVANWNLTQAEARALITGDIVAVQYASPDAGSTDKLPGSKLTIKQANVDLSVASVTWLEQVAARWPQPTPAPAKPKAIATVKKTVAKTHPKTVAGTIGAAAVAGATAFAKAKGVHLTGADTTLLTAAGAFLTASIAPAKKTS